MRHITFILLFGLLTKFNFAQNCENQLFIQTNYSFITAANDSLQAELNEGSRLFDITLIGDLDLDGNEDVVLGASNHNGQGAIFVCFLDSANNITRFQQIDASHGNFGYSLNYAATFGYESILIEDYNNDGVQDIMVSAYGDNTDGNTTGAVYIICLTRLGMATETYKIGYGTANIPYSVLSDNRMFGRALCNIGDVNDDGIIDVAIGSINYDDNGTALYGGAISILLMDTAGQVKNTQVISDNHANFNGTFGTRDAFGGSIELLGDIDNDGNRELMVSSFNGDQICTDCGANYLLSIDSVGDLISGNRFTGIDHLVSDGDLGSFLSKLPDLNNDGVDELVIAAYKSDNHTLDGGDMFMIYLNKNGEADSVINLITSYVPNEGANIRKLVYDVNGYTLIGAPLFNYNSESTGGVLSFENCEFEFPTNIEHVVDSKTNDFLVYPNPASIGERLFVSNIDVKNTTITIFNNLGQTVNFELNQLDNSEVSIRMQNNMNGLLFIQFEKDHVISVKKLMVQ